jgi:CPA2 family monovalent cation:H+ antiporter-2
MALPHDLPLIATVAIGLGVAFVAGLAAARLRVPPMVGYLLAGIAVGPFTPGFIADQALANQLAELGVILLMFGVGTHFSLRDLMAVRRIAIPGALAQILVATALGAALARWWGWSLGGALVFGLALSVASTVVLLRALDERGKLDSLDGRIAVGWLVVEDLIMVLTLLLLPALAGALGGQAGAAPGVGADLLFSVAITLAKIVLLFVLLYAVGVRLFPWVFGQLGRAGSRELLTLFVTSVAISLAYGAAELFGVSFALGAFLAGVVVNEAKLAHRITSQVEALEHVFGVLFFISVGMLFNPAVLVDEPLRVLAVVGIIMVGKSVAALGIVLAFRYPLRTALTVAASLGQIGEFSFILVGLGVALGLMPPEGRDLVLAGALISISLNALTFKIPELLEKHMAAWPTLAARLERKGGDLAHLEPGTPPPSGHVVLIGYGRVGRVIGRSLLQAGVPFVVIERNREEVARVRRKGRLALVGDGAVEEVLRNAGITSARLLVIATPDGYHARRIHAQAVAMNPALEIAVRTHSDDEHRYFVEQGVGLALMAEREIAQGLTAFVLRACGKSPDRVS